MPLRLAPDALWFPPLVETLIAMSIVYMALENIVGAATRRRWAITFIFGLVHGRRIVINDYANTNPFKSCDAINLRRDSEDLREMLEESVGFNIDVPAKSSD